MSKPHRVAASAEEAAALRASGKWKEGVPLFWVDPAGTFIDAGQWREMSLKSLTNGVTATFCSPAGASETGVEAK